MDILDQFRRTAERNALKFSVGRQMFCPKCQRVLDAKRAVNVTTTMGEPREVTVCAECWGHGPERHGKFAIGPAVCDVLDGRALWPRRARKGAK